MNSRLFWKSLGVQAAGVVLLAGILIALPLPDDFFDDWGFLTGPIAWLAASLVTARFIDQPLSIVLFSAAAGGVAGLIVLLVASHWPGLAVALLVFAASSASYDATAEPAA